MSHETQGSVVVLDTGLFPDSSAVEEVIELLTEKHSISRFDLKQGQMESVEWDRVLAAIIESEQVISI